MNQKRMIYKLVSILVVTIFIYSAIFSIMLLNPGFNTVKAGSTWTETSDIDYRNGLVENLTIVGSGENAELQNEFSLSPGWYEKKLSIKPSPREHHAMATIHGTDKVLLVGGNYGMTYLNDTWVYDLSKNEWANMNPVGSKPNATFWHTLAPIYGTDKVLLLVQTTVFETWVYDFSDNKWTNMKPINNIPNGIFSLTASYIYGTQKVIIFGGNYYSAYYNDTWIYDLNQNTWTNMYPLGTIPHSRAFHGMAPIYKTDKVMLYGGSFFTGTGTQYYYETWIYNTSNNTWTQKSPGSWPPGCQHHKMATIYGSDEVLLFGGSSNGNNTWFYDFSDDIWTVKSSLGAVAPSVRWYHGMATIDGTDYIILFGGSSYRDDTWVYKHFLISKNGTYISKPLDTGSNSSFNKISWFANIPAKTSIKFQLRTADNESNLGTKKFVGPDGSSDTYYMTSGATIWSGHHSDRWVQYKAYLNISIKINYDQSPQLKEVTISYNCLPRTIAFAPVDGCILTDNKPEFIWTFEDYDSQYQKAVQLLIDDDINFRNAAYDTGELITKDESLEFPTGTNYTALPDGIWYWKMRTMDEDGAWTDFTSPRMFKLDTHLPRSVVTIPINDGFYKNVTLISGIANDPIGGLGLLKIELAIKRTSDNYYWDGMTWVQNPCWLLTNGTKEWRYDCSGISWDSGYQYNVRSRATDNVSKVEQPSPGNVFTIDRDNPLSKIEVPKNNVWLNKLDIISGSSVDIGGSGVDGVKICIKCIKDYINWDSGAKDNDYWNGARWTTDEAWVTAKGTEQWYYDSNIIEWTTGNHYAIRAQAIDKIGNEDVSNQEITFMYDAQPPDVLETYINHGDEYTTASMVKLSIQAEDIGSGISALSLSSDGIDWSNWEPFKSEMNFSLTPMDGEKSVYFKVRDITGNIAEPVFDRIFLDTTPPDKLSITINDNDEYTNSNQITLTLDAVDIGSGLKDMAFSNNGVTWSTWVSFKNQRFYQLPASDGKKIVYFKVRDNAGNIAQPISDSIILDKTPPHSLSILIDKGAHETNDSSMTIDLFALDNLSGVHQMSFSNDGINWSSWEDYMEKRPYFLPPGEGVKIVYFKVKDYAGNSAEPVEASIVLSAPPEPSISHPSKESSMDFEYWLILIILIIILIVVFILGLVLFKKQEKRIKQKLLLTGAVTVKREALPGPTVAPEQVPPATTPERLPGTITTEGVTLPSISSTSTPQPQLAKSTRIGQTPPAQPAPQLSHLLQLPPATVQTEETKPEVKDDGSN